MDNNCNISNFAKNIINGSITGTQDILSSKSLLQSYINRIGCSSVKEVFCVDSNIMPCDKTVKKGCKFYISSLTKTSVSNGIEIGTTFSTGLSPYTYLWSWDETLATLKSGSSAADSILKLEYIGGSAPQYLEVSLNSKDSNGCIDAFSERINTCIPCDNKRIEFSLTSNVCKSSNIVTIDGEEYFKAPILLEAYCATNTDITSKITSVSMDIIGYQNNYPNGLIMEGGNFFFAIKKSDIHLLELNKIRLKARVKDCVYVDLEKEAPIGYFACCVKCDTPLISIIDVKGCRELVTAKSELYYKYVLEFDLKCGTKDITQYITNIEIDNNPNVEYFYEPTGVPGVYNFFVKQEDFELMCSYVPVLTPTTFNFDVTGDWSVQSVTDQASFLSFLQIDNPTASINMFNFAGNRLQANVTDTTLLILKAMSLTSIDLIPEMAENLNTNSNVTLTAINATIPSTMTSLSIQNNQLTDFPTIPPSVTNLNVVGNSLTTSVLDRMAGEFLTGTLPKFAWRSQSQSTGDKPSTGVQTNLTNNVTTVTV